jgi:hypothetical protein
MANKSQSISPARTEAKRPHQAAPGFSRTSTPLQRLHAVQHALGNQGVLGRLQAKLTINQPGDIYEQEADHVADAVMSSANLSAPLSPALRVGASAAVQRKCAACEKEEDNKQQTIQRKEASPVQPTIVTPIVGKALASPGRPLDPGTRCFMEDRFRHDFSDVRVHTDQIAVDSTESINALAYTVGRDVVFGAGQYNPGSATGKRLLAHELTHVIQQNSAVFSPSLHDSASSQLNGGVTVRARSSSRVARQTGPVQLPRALSFLTEDDVRKLQVFGDSDFQSSVNTLQGHLRKTQGTTQAGNPQQYIDIRQAAGEVRTFLDYVRDPDVVAVKVVPSATGGRSPDLYIRWSNGTETRAEVYNVTLASSSVRPELTTGPIGQRLTIPKVESEGGTHVVLPTNEFDVTAVRDAIRSKIKSSSKGPSQLVSQNRNTQVGGRPMATGGDVVIQITHGEIPRTRLDQIIHDLEPELVSSSAQRVVISAIDADEPRAGRKVFVYSRQGNSFSGSARTPFYRPVTPEPLRPPSAGGIRMGGQLRGIGGAVFNILLMIALAYVFEKLRQWLEKGQVEEGIRKLEPAIADAIDAKGNEIIELQSSSDTPVFSTINYSITFRQTKPDPMAKSLFEVSGEMDPSDREAMRQTQQAYNADQNQTFFAGAHFFGVTIGSGTKPENQESFSLVHDKYNLYDDYVSTLTTSVVLPRMSNVDLRDYVLSQALQNELAPSGTVSPERTEELGRRLERLQAAVAREEAQNQAEEERNRQAEERRKAAKLAAARAAANMPPTQTAVNLVPQPGPKEPVPLSPAADPFNLSGRAVEKSLFERATDAADIAEAMKSEYVRNVETLKTAGSPSEQVREHQKQVENWIKKFRDAFEYLKTNGSREWPGVKRLEFLSWWVDQAAGRSALSR